MKGNEARVVFFLHPVNQFKDGEVAKVEKSFWSFFGFRPLLLPILLGLLLGLGVLAYLLMAQREGRVPVVSTINASIATATTRTTSVTLNSAPTTTTATEPGGPELGPANSSGMIADLSPGIQKQTRQSQTDILSS